MKNKILYSLILAMLIFVACDDDDENEDLLASSNVTTDAKKLTIFDTPFELGLTLTNSDVASVNVSGGAAINQDVAVVDKKASLTLSAADFGDDWKIGSALALTSTIDFKSHKSVKEHTINIIDAITATGEGIIHEYDSAPQYIEFKGETMVNDMDMVLVEKKVKTLADPDPDFVEVVSAMAQSEYVYNDSVFGVDYDLLDTIVYKITATAGDLTETKMVEIAVGSKALTVGTNAMLSATEDIVVFMPDEKAGDAGVISFTASQNISGFESSDIQFVKVEVGTEFEKEEDLYNFSKVVEVVDNALLVSAYNNVVIGDRFAFKYPYKGNMLYGFITITDVTSEEIGDAENGFEFTYTQNVKFNK